VRATLPVLSYRVWAGAGGAGTVKRREFVALLASAALARPRRAIAQSSERIRVVGNLGAIPVEDPGYQLNFAALKQGYRDLGWVEGRNLRIEARGVPSGDTKILGATTADLVALAPDVIVAFNEIAVAAAHQATRTIPIVFLLVDDPVGHGFVVSIARPGGNMTGFVQHEPSIGGKWLQLLKQMSPSLSRVATVFNPTANPDTPLFERWIEAAAASFSVEVTPMQVHEKAEIDASIANFAREPNGGLIVPGDPFTIGHRTRVIGAAAHYRLPAIYPIRNFATEGGLMTYGYDQLFQVREAASYVDRILRGAAPADLPVQSPKKYEFVINLKTAAALGLAVPPQLLTVADAVIE